MSDLTISTGYFAKAKAYADAGYALVSIALKSPWFLPKDIHLFHIPSLFPTAELLALKDNPDEYTPTYQTEILAKCNPDEILDILMHFAEEEKTDKVILLCWENPSKFCHRHIVADWLSRGLNIRIYEFLA